MLTHYLDDHQLSRNVCFECAIHLLFPSNAFGSTSAIRNLPGFPILLTSHDFMIFCTEKELGDASPLNPALKNGNSSSRSRHIASDLNRHHMSELVCPNFYCEVPDLSCFYPKCFLAGLRI